MNQRCKFFTIEPETTPEQEEQQKPRELKVRLDKWLWAARFFKTPALARAAIKQRKVLYNGELVSPSIEIQLHAKVDISLSRFSKTIIITGLSTRRKSATDSLGLFKELPSQCNPSQGNLNANYTDEGAPKRSKKIVRFLRRNLCRNVSH